MTIAGIGRIGKIQINPENLHGLEDSQYGCLTEKNGTEGSNFGFSKPAFIKFSYPPYKPKRPNFPISKK